MPVAIVFAIPGVVVLHSAPVAFPISAEEPLAVMMRAHPPGARVRRTRPVARMPDPPAIYRIPVAVYPRVVRTGRHRPHRDNAGTRRRTNADSDPDLRAKRQ